MLLSNNNIITIKLLCYIPFEDITVKTKTLFNSLIIWKLFVLYKD